jgi:hypothetical protein
MPKFSEQRVAGRDKPGHDSEKWINMTGIRSS